MTETDYKATPEQWKLLQRQGQTLGSAESIALLELRSRVETLEATQQPRTFTAQEVTPIVAPTTRLHSYKVGKAESIDDWSEGHTLAAQSQSVAKLTAASSSNRDAIVARLRQLAHAVTLGPEAVARETNMRVPAEPLRDADLVLSTAADLLAQPEPLAPTDEDLEDLAEVMNVSGNPVPAMRRALELWGHQ